jgi:peptidoglycan hydrolase CwlO-like protein
VAAPEPPTDPLVIAKLGEAEKETSDLQKELEKLDAEWSKRLSEMQEQTGRNGEATPPPTAIANVISLANRIRDLKKGIGAS